MSDQPIQTLIDELAAQFPFISGSVAAEVKSAIEIGMARAHKAGKDGEAELAASIARGILTRCQGGRIRPTEVVTVILRKVAAGADLAMEEAAPEQLYRACPMCGACYTRENFSRLVLCGVMHNANHTDCLELRMCTCGDSMSVDILCSGMSGAGCHTP